MTEKDFKDLCQFVENYNKFAQVEYADDTEISLYDAVKADLLGVMFTDFSDYDYENEEDIYVDCEIQLSYRLSDKTLNYWLDGLLIRQEQFESFEEMARDIQYARFDDYCEIANDTIRELMAKDVIYILNDRFEFKTTENIVNIV